jgi:hypothetical protein
LREAALVVEKRAAKPARGKTSKRAQT